MTKETGTIDFLSRKLQRPTAFLLFLIQDYGNSSNTLLFEREEKSEKYKVPILNAYYDGEDKTEIKNSLSKWLSDKEIGKFILENFKDDNINIGNDGSNYYICISLGDIQNIIESEMKVENIDKRHKLTFYGWENIIKDKSLSPYLKVLGNLLNNHISNEE